MAQFIYKHRRGTTEKWQAATSIIPYDGELIIEERTDGTFEIKVGDGVHNFNDLPYISKEEIVKSDLAQALKDELDGKATKQYVDDAIEAIPTPDVSGQINAHNTSSTAHSDIRTAIGKKLDTSAVTGDLLTHNAAEFATAEHDHAIADVTGLQSELDGKQAKGNYVTAVTGKGLSTNDFTTAEKEKLAGIAVGANNYTYTLPAAGTDLGGVKTGGDVTINAGVITVSDDSHNHTFATVTGLQAALDGKQAKGSYAAADHNHDDVYSKIGHKHTKSEITDFPTSMTPTAHNQASNTINAMTGYSKPSSTSAIAATDSLNAAIGKLETALDGKQASGSYSTTGHKHTKSEITDFPTNATTSTDGLMSSTDKEHLDTLAALLEGEDSTIDTITEVLKAFENAPEGTNIANALAGKVDKVSGKGLSTNDLTAPLKSNYDAAYTHSQATHARTDATKVEASSTNGQIKINGTETTVYVHPTGTNPHGTTKSDVGLGNVGNFKAVSTVASQGLTDTEKSNARANIGAGTSSLTIGTSDTTAAAGNHTHSYIPLAGGSLNDSATLKFTTYGTRTVTVSGNSIDADMSADTGTWAGNFATLKHSKGTTPMLGWYGSKNDGLYHIFMGGSYDAPAMKMDAGGNFTFKNTPKVGSVDVALTSDLPTFTYDSTTKTLTIS